MLDKGIIRESDSPFKSPVCVVPKKLDASGERKFRMVMDFRILNDKTIGDQYPLPNILTIFDQVGNAEYYTVLDLACGFHQIKLCESDAHKTAFATDVGLYEYVKMPFGLKNSPATFQRMIDKALRGLQGVELFVCIDDIVIYAKSLEERAIKFKKYNLKLQLDKCGFLKKKVQYLGHVLNKDGLEEDQRKIKAVKNFPIPKNVKNIREFLGLAYYNRFIKYFTKMAKPMTRILQKNITIEILTYKSLNSGLAYSDKKDSNLVN